jgi:hypothetical protein
MAELSNTPNHLTKNDHNTVAHIEQSVGSHLDMEEGVRDWAGVLEDARRATQEEHRMTIWEAI